MATRTFTMSGSIAGLTVSGTFQRTGSGEDNGEVTLAAGAAGTLTTRTDNDTGTITASSASHGIATADTVDVYWSGGIRRGMTVGTVSGTSIPIDLGAGDNLPIATTAIVIDKQEILDLDSTASTIVMAAVGQTRRASVQFQQNGGTAILSLDLGLSGNDGEGYLWVNNSSVAIPFGSDIGKVAVSNGSSAGTNVVRIGILRT